MSIGYSYRATDHVEPLSMRAERRRTFREFLIGKGLSLFHLGRLNAREGNTVITAKISPALHDRITRFAHDADIGNQAAAVRVLLTIALDEIDRGNRT